MRHTTINIDLGEPRPANAFKVYPDGRVELLMDGVPILPREVRTEISYDRPRKKKVLTSNLAENTASTADPSDALRRADRIYWIDTNSREYNGQRIHTTAVIRGTPYRGHKQTFLECDRELGLEFRGVVDRPEAFAWCEVMERMRRRPQRLLDRRYCLVVDSDLGQLDAINRRQRPIWGDYYLPLNFALLYASADVGKEIPAALFMAECDKCATRLFDTVVASDPEGRYVRELSLVGSILLRTWTPVPDRFAA